MQRFLNWRWAAVLLIAGALMVPHLRGGTSSAATGQTRTYAAGYNLIAAPPGTDLAKALAVFTLQPGDSMFRSASPLAMTSSGFGYWVYFGDTTTVTLDAGTQAPYTVTAAAGKYFQIGNPSGLTTATISGADYAYTYQSDTGYQQTSQLQPGDGAWVYSELGGVITVTPSQPSATPIAGTPVQSGTTSPTPTGTAGSTPIPASGTPTGTPAPGTATTAAGTPTATPATGTATVPASTPSATTSPTPSATPGSGALRTYSSGNGYTLQIPAGWQAMPVPSNFTLTDADILSPDGLQEIRIDIRPRDSMTPAAADMCTRIMGGFQANPQNHNTMVTSAPSPSTVTNADEASRCTAVYTDGEGVGQTLIVLAARRGDSYFVLLVEPTTDFLNSNLSLVAQIVASFQLTP